MTYADYLSRHSYLHLLGGNSLYAEFPRLAENSSSRELELQLESLEIRIQERKNKKVYGMK
jgi:hypothetical protein